jgi:hypothetical protein
MTMTEFEIPLHVKCPICLKESPTGYRISVVAEALQTLQIRLYAGCHVTSWDASDAELAQIRESLDAVWRENLHGRPAARPIVAPVDVHGSAMVRD